MYRLAADWPSTMQIVRLISQEHMKNRLSSLSTLSFGKQFLGGILFLNFCLCLELRNIMYCNVLLRKYKYVVVPPIV
jgi:hypothetical protein